MLIDCVYFWRAERVYTVFRSLRLPKIDTIYKYRLEWTPMIFSTKDAVGRRRRRLSCHFCEHTGVDTMDLHFKITNV